MSLIAEAIRRLWQPRKGLFWLALGFNALSSFMVGFIHLNDPPTGIRLVVSLFALTNSLLGWWLTVRLWREGDPKPSP
ncbi:MAG: hypothetical protein AB7S86_05175 [Hydrogenophaga sp.]|uniref:hypothetical protein n=1 Tax=Hydrogenophaga sp. TaxID=1904254 RepID=UPI003D11076E